MENLFSYNGCHTHPESCKFLYIRKSRLPRGPDDVAIFFIFIHFYSSSTNCWISEKKEWWKRM